MIETKKDPKVLVIEHKGETFAYPLPFWSNCKNAEGRQEENLMFGAVEMYDRIYMHPVGMCLGAYPPGMASSQFALPFIAKHYGLDRIDILKAWTHQYGVHRAMGDLPNNNQKREGENE
jgi:hypothetical protein